MTKKAQSDIRSPNAPQVYLILQGLGSPFFKQLGSKLADEGGTVHRVNFCGGDWWFSDKLSGWFPGHAKNHRFNGELDTLGTYYRTLIERHGITTIILFGDCRPVHKVAREVAAELGLNLWVFEEGYIRPGFVTCEVGGTNDLSAMPRTMPELEDNMAASAAHRATCEPWHGTSPMPARVRMDLTHHLWNILLKPFYFRYRTHRPDRMGAEIKGWLARMARKLRHKNLNAALIKRYENSDKPFFMVPLQLNSDFQIREHSNYESVLEFVRETVASFAHHAPKSALLMFKSHPLDNGMIDYRSYIAMAAMKHNIEGRVDYLEGGDLKKYLIGSEGVILINSTVAYVALALAKPMKVMGRALYDMAGLTDQQSLDKFWKNPTAPNNKSIDIFMDVVRAECQIPGDLFTKAGIETATQAAANRILAHTKNPVHGVTTFSSPAELGKQSA